MSESAIRFTRRYVWQPVVRWYQWINVLCMGILEVTGFYIGTPFVNATGFPFPYVTAIARFVHFVTARILVMALLVCIYWAFVGNRHAWWEGILPLRRERRRDLWKQLLYHVFLASDRPCHVGHSPIESLSYAGLWLPTIAQGITGLALNAEVNPGGFWRTWFDRKSHGESRQRHETDTGAGPG